MNTLCYFNGEEKKHNEIHLHVSDLGLTRGYGIFDFLRSSQGVPLFLEDYLNRFFNSAEELLLKVPKSKAEISEIIYHLIEQNSGGDWGIRLMLTGGYSTDYFTPYHPNFMILLLPLHFPTEEKYKEGINLMTYYHQREKAEVKSLNYLTSIYMRNKLAEADAHDLLYHYQDVVSESSRSNIFFVKEGKLITPQEQILNGITRKQVITLAQEELELEIRTVTLAELTTFEEAFITSTTKRVMPVGKIDGKPLPKVQGEITQLLQQKFDTLEKEYIIAYQAREVKS